MGGLLQLHDIHVKMAAGAELFQDGFELIWDAQIQCSIGTCVNSCISR